MTRGRLSVFLALCCVLVGCEFPAAIIVPPHPLQGGAYSTTSDPVLSFQVRFGSNYQGNFNATLDGVDWTSRFAPAPTPKGVSTAPSPPIFTGGQPYVVNGEIVPNSWNHVLEASGDCPWPCLNSVDSVRFAPPNLSFRPNFVKIARFQSVSIDVEIPVAPSMPVTVQLTPTNALSLNGRPAGQPITVIIPTNNSRALFTATGLSQGNASIGAAAAGCQVANAGFSISP